MQRKRTAVLVSGNGSNLQALIDAAAAPDFPAEIALVLSNKANAYGLKRAEASGIATRIVAHTDYASREAFDGAMDSILRAEGIELVCLAGFMRLLSPDFVQGWLGRMINIHPSILPAFKGLHTHQRAIEAQVRLHGCSVHFVVPEMDAGPLIVQAAVPVLPEDDEEALAARVLAQEHRIYPQALEWLASNKVQLDAHGHVAFAKPLAPSDCAFISPQW